MNSVMLSKQKRVLRNQYKAAERFSFRSLRKRNFPTFFSDMVIPRVVE